MPFFLIRKLIFLAIFIANITFIFISRSRMSLVDQVAHSKALIAIPNSKIQTKATVGLGNVCKPPLV